MRVEILKTGIRDIDEALSGGLINKGILLINYDKRSLGGVLAVKILKQMIENGAIGVILNTALPLSKLKLRANYLGWDIEKDGKRGNLFIIDLFGSKYEIHEDETYVYQIEDWSDETGVSKLMDVYKELESKIPKDKVIVGAMATLDTMYHNFNEDVMHKILRFSLASIEMQSMRDIKLVIIALLNRDAVPEHINAMLYSLSDQIIEFNSKICPSGLESTIVVVKSLVPGFTPYHYTLKLSKECYIQLF